MKIIMDKEQSVWKQIDEDEEDYQYFKERDQEQLYKTMESLVKNYPLEKEQEV